MPTVDELSSPYGNFMLNPRPGPGVCMTCFNLTDGYERCYACTKSPQVLAAMAPISYSVAGEQLHHALANYKRLSGAVAGKLTRELAAVLWRFLRSHERCLASVAEVDGFDAVTTVPSSYFDRDEHQPLRTIVSQLVAVTRERHRRLLRRSGLDMPPHTFHPEKYMSCQLSGEAVLLIDDTWTTGANAQSAAAALRRAGAGPVAAVVIGRHVTRQWRANDDRLRMCVRPFDWGLCALCAAQADSPHEPGVAVQPRASAARPAHG